MGYQIEATHLLEDGTSVCRMLEIKSHGEACKIGHRMDFSIYI